MLYSQLKIKAEEIIKLTLTAPVVAENFMQIHDAAFFLVIAVIGSWLGAVLGIKYYKLDNSGKS